MDEEVLGTMKRVADEMFERDGGGAYSAAERIAGAFLNNRTDWLPDNYSNVMMAINRLGPEWREALVEAAMRDWNGRW